MPRFNPHSFLACVLPTIIAVLSVYWFRKKRKLKESDDCTTIPKVPDQIDYQTVESNLFSKQITAPIQCKEESGKCITFNIEETLNTCNLMDNSLLSNIAIDTPILESESDSLSDTMSSSQEVKCNGFLTHCEKNSCTLDSIMQSTSNNSSICDEISENFKDKFLETPLNIIYDSNTTVPFDKNLGLFQPVTSDSWTSSNHQEHIKNTKVTVDHTHLSMDNHKNLEFENSTDHMNSKDSSLIESEQTISSPISNPSDCDVLSSVGTSSISLSEFTFNSSLNSPPELSSAAPTETTVDEEFSFDSGKGSTRGSISRSSENHELDNSSEMKQFVDSLLQSSNGDGFSDSNGESIKKDVSEPNCGGSSNSLTSSKCESNPSPHQRYGDSRNETSASNKSIHHSLESKNYENPSKYVYEFELASDLCGRLIGRQGKHVKYIKELTNATVCIKRHPFNDDLKLISVEGSRHDVNCALDQIRKRYPLSQFPNVTLIQTNSPIDALNMPEPLQLQLPENVSIDVLLSSMVTAGHFFLQQPTHPTYPSLAALDQCMMQCYTQADTPLLPNPIDAGVICAATIMGGWYRAQVMYVFENGEQCEVKYVDYGGYSQLPLSSLRQIRSDFMSLPFQASECYLANVQPANADGWTPEASAIFEELAQGQILQAIVMYFHEDGMPCVHLYRVQGVTSTFINRELVNRGFAKWVDNP